MAWWTVPLFALLFSQAHAQPATNPPTYIWSPLYANGGIYVNSLIPGILLNKPASGQPAYISGQTTGKLRWQEKLGDESAETGSDVGSSFLLNAFNDAGSDKGSVLSISRATLASTMNALTVTNSFTNNNIISTELPSLSASVQSSGESGFDMSSCTSVSTCGFFIFQKPTSTAGALNSALYIQRNTLLLSGGTTSTVPANLYMLDYSGRNDISWNSTFVSVLHNQSLGTTASQNTGGIMQGIKEASTGGGEVGATWGANIYAWDTQPTVNPTYGLVGGEVDAYVSAGGSTDTSANRVILDLVGGTNGTADAGVHIGEAMRITTTGSVILDKGISFYGPFTLGTLLGSRNGTITATKGFDLTSFTFSGNIFATPNYVMDNNSNQTTTSGAPSFTFNAPSSGQVRVFNSQTNGVLRWQMKPGNGTAEGGSNAGSDFTIEAYTDGGGYIGMPLLITRSSMAATFGGALTVTGATTASGALSATAAGTGLAVTNNETIGGTSTITGNVSTAAHYLNTSAVPTISACGTTPPAATAGSSNSVGQFTVGTGGTVTACTITFSAAYPNTAFCTVSPVSSTIASVRVSAQSKTAFTVTFSPATASQIFQYTCGGT